MFYSWIPKTVPGLTKCFILEKPTFWSWWMNLPEINGSRISLKMRQNYRTFCRTLLGHPGQFLTTTDQLSYYLIIRLLWLAVPNGPIRISIANELRLNDLFFGHTFFRHFSDYWWRHHFYDVFIILYLFIYFRQKTKQKMAQQENNREFLITHTQWDQAQVNSSWRHYYVIVT